MRGRIFQADDLFFGFCFCFCTIYKNLKEKFTVIFGYSVDNCGQMWYNITVPVQIDRTDQQTL